MPNKANPADFLVADLQVRFESRVGNTLLFSFQDAKVEMARSCSLLFGTFFQCWVIGISFFIATIERRLI